jgi:tyrosinase
MPVLSKITSPEIGLEDLGQDYTRADIELEGLDHSGSTYEGRVYLNNPDADGNTEPSAENGYAGSYYVFGHGGCYGGEGHCDVVPRGPYDPRPPHGLSPTRKVVIATDAIRRAAAAGPQATVTIVPVLLSTTDRVPEDEAIPSFQSLAVIAYR